VNIQYKNYDDYEKNKKIEESIRVIIENIKKFLVSILVVFSFLLLSFSSVRTLSLYANIQTLDSFTFLPHDIIFDYNDEFKQQEFTFDVPVFELDTFNSLTIYFYTQGADSTNDGLNITFILDQIAVEFTIDRRYQDGEEHNLTKAFTFSPSFNDILTVKVVCEGQAYWYQEGTLVITTRTAIQTILIPVIDETSPTAFPLIPNWLIFSGSISLSIPVRESVYSAMICENSTSNFQLNLTYTANTFAAYSKQIEIRINETTVASSKFVCGQNISLSFLFTPFSGVNILSIDFVVLACSSDIIISNIQLSGRFVSIVDDDQEGGDNSSNTNSTSPDLPENILAYAEWNIYGYIDYSFDISKLLSYAENGSEQRITADLTCGFLGNPVSSMYYELKMGTEVLTSGYLDKAEQIPLFHLNIDTYTTFYSPSLSFHFYGLAQGEGSFYIFDNSTVELTPLPVYEDEELQRIILVEQTYSPTSDVVTLIFTDYFHVRSSIENCYVFVLFDLFNEYDKPVDRIDIKMYFNSFKELDETVEKEGKVNVSDYIYFYYTYYKVELHLTIHCDGHPFTLSGLQYCLKSNNHLSDSTDSTLPTLPPFTDPYQEPKQKKALRPSAKIVSLIEGAIDGIFLLVFLWNFADEEKRKTERKNSNSRTITLTLSDYTVKEGVISKGVDLIKNVGIFITNILFRFGLLPLTILFLAFKYFILIKLTEQINEIGQLPLFLVKSLVVGKIGYWGVVNCIWFSTCVCYAIIILTTHKAIYKDACIYLKFIGIPLPFGFFVFWILSFIYIKQNTNKSSQPVLLGISFLTFFFIIIATFGNILRRKKEHMLNHLNIIKNGKIELTVDEYENESSDRERDKLDLSFEDQKYRLHYVLTRLPVGFHASVTFLADKAAIPITSVEPLLQTLLTEDPELGTYDLFTETFIRKNSLISEEEKSQSIPKLDAVFEKLEQSFDSWNRTCRTHSCVSENQQRSNITPFNSNPLSSNTENLNLDSSISIDSTRRTKAQKNDEFILQNFKSPTDEIHLKDDIGEKFLDDVRGQLRISYYIKYIPELTDSISFRKFLDLPKHFTIQDAKDMGISFEQWVAVRKYFFGEKYRKDKLLEKWLNCGTSEVKNGDFAISSINRVGFKHSNDEMIVIIKLLLNERIQAGNNVFMNKFINLGRIADYKNTPLFKVLEVISNVEYIKEKVTEDILQTNTQEGMLDIEKLFKMLSNQGKDLEKFISWAKKRGKIDKSSVKSSDFREILNALMNTYYDFRLFNTNKKEILHMVSTFYRDMIILQTPILSDALKKKFEDILFYRSCLGLSTTTLLSPWIKAVVDENGKVSQLKFSANLDEDYKIKDKWCAEYFKPMEDTNDKPIKFDQWLKKWDATKTGKDGFIKAENLIPIFHHINSSDGSKQYSITYEIQPVMVSLEAKCYKGAYVAHISKSKKISVNKLPKDAKTWITNLGVNVKNSVTFSDVPNGAFANFKNNIEELQKFFDVFKGKGSYSKTNLYFNKMELRNNFTLASSNMGFNAINLLLKMQIITGLRALKMGELVLKYDEDGFIILYDKVGKDDGSRLQLSHKEDILTYKQRGYPYKPKPVAYVSIPSIRLPSKDFLDVIEYSEVPLKIKGEIEYVPIKIHGESFSRTKQQIKTKKDGSLSYTSNMITVATIDGEEYSVSPVIFFAEDYKNENDEWYLKTNGNGLFYVILQNGETITASTASKLRFKILDYFKTSILSNDVYNAIPLAVVKSGVKHNYREEAKMIDELENKLLNGYYNPIKRKQQSYISIFETAKLPKNDVNYSPNFTRATSIFIQSIDNSINTANYKTRQQLMYGSKGYYSSMKDFRRYSVNDRMMMNCQGMVDYELNGEDLIGERISISNEGYDFSFNHRGMPTFLNKLLKNPNVDKIASKIAANVFLFDHIANTKQVAVIEKAIAINHVTAPGMISRGIRPLLFVEYQTRQVLVNGSIEERVVLDDVIRIIKYHNEKQNRKIGVITSDQNYIKEYGYYVSLEHLESYNKREEVSPMIRSAIENLNHAVNLKINPKRDSIFSIVPSNDGNAIKYDCKQIIQILEAIFNQKTKWDYSSTKEYYYPRNGPFFYSKEKAFEVIKKIYGGCNEKETVENIFSKESELKTAFELMLSNKGDNLLTKKIPIDSVRQITSYNLFIQTLKQLILRFNQAGSLKIGYSTRSNHFDYFKISFGLMIPFVTRLYNILMEDGKWVSLEENEIDRISSPEVSLKDKYVYLIKSDYRDEYIKIKRALGKLNNFVIEKNIPFSTESVKKYIDNCSINENGDEYLILRTIIKILSTYAKTPSGIPISEKSGNKVKRTKEELYYILLFDLVKAMKQLDLLARKGNWNRFEFWMGIALSNTWEAIKEIGKSKGLPRKLKEIKKILTEMLENKGLRAQSSNALVHARMLIDWTKLTDQYFQDWDYIVYTEESSKKKPKQKK